MANETLESWSYIYASGYVAGSESPPVVKKIFNNNYENIDAYPIGYSGVYDRGYTPYGSVNGVNYFIAYSGGGIGTSGIPIQENNQSFDNINVNNPIFWNGLASL